MGGEAKPAVPLTDDEAFFLRNQKEKNQTCRNRRRVQETEKGNGKFHLLCCKLLLDISPFSSLANAPDHSTIGWCMGTPYTTITRSIARPVSTFIVVMVLLLLIFVVLPLAVAYTSR